MKTLALRMKHQNESALKIARFLEEHNTVAKVNYPGLMSHPQHNRAGQLFAGFSGMLSFEPKGGKTAAEQFMKNVSIPIVAPSLGGVESLLTRPAATSHSGMSAEDRKKLGITDGLIRVSIGIEATDDLIEDFAGAFEAIRTIASIP
jgi:cystathionine beta-lyase/cystathionine gamma-synthase